MIDLPLAWDDAHEFLCLLLPTAMERFHPPTRHDNFLQYYSRLDRGHDHIFMCLFHVFSFACCLLNTVAAAPESPDLDEELQAVLGIVQHLLDPRALVYGLQGALSGVPTLQLPRQLVPKAGSSGDEGEGSESEGEDENAARKVSPWLVYLLKMLLDNKVVESSARVRARPVGIPRPHQGARGAGRGGAGPGGEVGWRLRAREGEGEGAGEG